MKISKYFPEVTAISAFFPMGVFMGYIMQYYFAGSLSQNRSIEIILRTQQWWPWFAGCCAALITGGVLFGIKIRYQQYRYEHFQLLNVGMLLFFTAGILFMATGIPYVPIYMSFIAHGISYITALSYINIRMGKTRFRSLRLSIPLVVYMFSIAIGATVVYRNLNVRVVNPPAAPVNETVGILLLISSIFTIACILTLEYNVYYGRLNYKSSLDEDINRENNNFSLFEPKYFVITSQHGNVEIPAARSSAPHKPLNALLFILFVIISKITSIMYFYWPFIYIHHFMSISSKNFDLFSINWFGLAGVIISTLCLIPMTYKLQYFIGLTTKLIYMALLLILFSFENWYTRQLTVVLWFLFMTLGFAYPNCDINILSYTNLKYTDVVLTAGYVVMNMIVGVIQYVTIQTPNQIIDDRSTFQLMFQHALAFLFILIALNVFGMIIMPNRDFKSLLELQNYINTFGLRSNSGSDDAEQINERDPINTSDRNVVTVVPELPPYSQPGPMQLFSPVSYQENVRRPPSYTSEIPEDQPPPYLSNSPVASGSSNAPPRKNEVR